MKLAKSLLLGSATAFVAVAGANAADLPSKKAAPATYVKVCDAYGAGFYTIPGSDTCVRITGKVRADFAFSGQKDVYASNVYAPTSGANIVGGYIYNNVLTKQATSSATDTSIFGTTHLYMDGMGYSAAAQTATIGTSFAATTTKTAYGYVAANGIAAKAQNLYGWEARSEIGFDARTATPYGTVQSVAVLQIKRTTGSLAEGGTSSLVKTAGVQQTAVYVRFAGFTFGQAKDNFAFMPSIFYGAGHWASFANGAKQLAYTAVLGGGLSATVGVQDAADTTNGGVQAMGNIPSYGGIAAILNAPSASNSSADGLANGAVAYSYNSVPQINARVDFEQSWGTISAMGAAHQINLNNTSGTYAQRKNAYAVGAGVKLNVPQLAAGDALWLNGGFAQGMTEYTTNWTSFKSSDTSRVVGGYVVNHPSWITTSTGIELVKSWNVAAVFQHFWAPQWRQAFLATYGAANGTTTSKALAWGQSAAFGDAKVWNVGTQIAFLPAKDFEIGVDVLYARVAQDIRRVGGTNTTGFTAGTSETLTGAYTTAVTRETAGNWTGRLRVERNF